VEPSTSRAKAILYNIKAKVSYQHQGKRSQSQKTSMQKFIVNDHDHQGKKTAASRNMKEKHQGKSLSSLISMTNIKAKDRSPKKSRHKLIVIDDKHQGKKLQCQKTSRQKIAVPKNIKAKVDRH
jgi:hypothetical protein